MESSVTDDLPNVPKDRYRPDEIEQLLKILSEPTKYSLMENTSQSIKSEVWSRFGFPGKIFPHGTHRQIPGFVSCFTCEKTFLRRKYDIYDQTEMPSVQFAIVRWKRNSKRN